MGKQNVKHDFGGKRKRFLKLSDNSGVQNTWLCFIKLKQGVDKDI